MTKKKVHCYLNGKIVLHNDAKVSIDDVGFLRGYGVFDYLRTYNGRPFLLDDHLERLINSANELNIKVGLSKRQIEKVLMQLLKKNKFQESAIKIVVTGGLSEDGIFPSGTSTMVVIAKPISTDPKTIKRGVKIITQEHKRELPEAKTLNYIKLLTKRDEIKKKNAFTLLFTKDRRVLEGATSNIFASDGKSLFTPKNDVLKGITRGLVIKLAKRHKIKIVEKEIYLNKLLKYPEIFLTTTSHGIIPVVKIDNRKIGNGKPGKLTNKLISIYNNFTSNY
jgi:branched-chain amino acid aminotransferase